MDPKVLSIQSHVVSGYVGNKSAVFPLQVLGFEVDFINSVQFSNHTWYKVFKGQVLNSEDLDNLYTGLKANGLDNYSHILTGYIGAASFLETVCKIVQEQKEKNSELIYVCDPVMGDNGKLYVPEELVPIYREKMLSLADIIVPNQFEAELLSEMKISDEESALKAIDFFHSKGVPKVVFSSTDLGDSEKLIGYASVNINGKKTRVKMEIPRLEGFFVGTGDLFAALFLAWSHHHPDDLKLVCQKVLGTMQTVLRGTLAHGRSLVGAGDAVTPAQLELRLVKHRKVLENPDLFSEVHLL